MNRSPAIITAVLALLLSLLLASLPADAQPRRPAATSDQHVTLTVLSYHDIRDDVAESGDADAYAVSTQNFAAHLDWLHGNGYQPVSLQQVIDASQGGKPLPDKALLLTFDDGLRSVYTHAFPLLRAYGYPAVAAAVTSWIDMPPGSTVDYGPRLFGPEDFLTWAQMREMQASGLVEVVSHSHAMHLGLRSNPQGNTMPAATVRQYLADQARYETDEEYRARVHADLAASAAAIERELGQRPRAIVWPYAAYSNITNRIADDLGMRMSFDLEGRDQPVGPGSNLHGLARLLIFDNPQVNDLVYELRRDRQLEGMRAIQLDMDYLYDPDPEQLARNLDLLIERMHRIRPSHVFLQAFADPDGDGAADALYFPNRHLPMRADLFNRVAWLLRTRAGVRVFAWMPVMAFKPPDPALRRELSLPEREGEFFRLDPSNPRARALLRDLYEDLGKAGYFEGIHFHDDAYLRDDELTAHYPDGAARTRALVELTEELRHSAELWRPKLLSSRNLYARPVLQPQSEHWFGQRLDAFLDAYDYTTLMAMPWLENASDPDRWMQELVDEVRRHDPRLEGTMFQLQTVDWRTRQPIPGARLQAQIRALMADGVRHLAWYPDDFIKGHPALPDARGSISARSFPYEDR